MRIKKISFWQALIAYLGLSIFVGISAQESNDGTLRSRSLGRIDLSLQITNRPNPTLTLVNRGGGSSSIPAFLEETLTRALGQKRNVEFPVCLAGGDDSVTLSVESEGSEEMVLTGTNGEKIPYEVSIKGNQGFETGNRKKAQYKKPASGTCDEDSALKVEITLPEDIPLASTISLRGKFRLMVTTE